MATRGVPAREVCDIACGGRAVCMANIYIYIAVHSSRCRGLASEPLFMDVGTAFVCTVRRHGSLKGSTSGTVVVPTLQVRAALHVTYMQGMDGRVASCSLTFPAKGAHMVRGLLAVAALLHAAATQRRTPPGDAVVAACGQCKAGKTWQEQVLADEHTRCDLPITARYRWW